MNARVIADAYRRDGASVVDFANTRMQPIRILNYGVCTGCLKLASQAYQYDNTGMSSAITLVMGPNATQSQVTCHRSRGDVVLCGHCAAPTYFNQLKGCYVPGCPPRNEDLVKTLKDLTIHRVALISHDASINSCLAARSWKSVYSRIVSRPYWSIRNKIL